jgi:hypothetical protein
LRLGGVVLCNHKKAFKIGWRCVPLMLVWLKEDRSLGLGLGAGTVSSLKEDNDSDVSATITIDQQIREVRHVKDVRPREIDDSKSENEFNSKDSKPPILMAPMHSLIIPAQKKKRFH